ncbi:MAG: M14 family metallopeptidase [Myxococcota bacterium]
MVALPLLLSLAASPHGDALVRVHAPTPEDVAIVDALGLDVWTEVPLGETLDLRVRDTERAMLDASGLPYEILVPDLGPRVDAERFRLTGPTTHGGELDPFFDEYQPLDAIEERLGSLATLRPDRVTALQPGESFEGRTLRGLEITAADPDAPVFFINGGQHAREWIAIAATTCVADRLVREADTERVDGLLSQLRVVVVPVVNPDGYVYSWEEDRYWRKNRPPPNGVDLNRNFGTAWGGIGASANPEAGNFHGEGPFSEPEAQAMRDLAEGFGTLLAHLDVHAYGELVLYPWGFDIVEAPDDDVLAPAANVLADGMSAPHDTSYLPIPGAALYPAAGNIMDWVYGELGAYSYGIELRPDGETDPGQGFVLPPEQIRPVCDELYGGVLDLAEHVLGEMPVGPGDDGAATGPRGDSSTGDAPDPPGPSDDSSTGVQPGGTGGGEDSGTSGATPPAGDDTTASDAGGSGSGGDTDPALDADDGGCGCRSAPPSTAALMVLMLLGLRRRRAG